MAADLSKSLLIRSLKRQARRWRRRAPGFRFHGLALLGKSSEPTIEEGIVWGQADQEIRTNRTRTTSRGRGSREAGSGSSRANRRRREARHGSAGEAPQLKEQIMGGQSTPTV